MKKILALVCAFLLLAAVPFGVLAEGGMQLVVQTEAHGGFSMLENDRMKARFTVTNDSADKTVEAFEMRVYAVNAQGRRIWGDSTYYYWTTKKEIAPGDTACSDYITLPDRSDVDTLYVAVKKYVCTDGTIAETADESLKYQEWKISWD